MGGRPSTGSTSTGLPRNGPSVKSAFTGVPRGLLPGPRRQPT
jgi:hypothetical protein